MRMVWPPHPIPLPRNSPLPIDTSIAGERGPELCRPTGGGHLREVPREVADRRVGPMGQSDGGRSISGTASSRDLSTSQKTTTPSEGHCRSLTAGVVSNCMNSTPKLPKSPETSEVCCGSQTTRSFLSFPEFSASSWVQASFPAVRAVSPAFPAKPRPDTPAKRPSLPDRSGSRPESH